MTSAISTNDGEIQSGSSAASSRLDATMAGSGNRAPSVGVDPRLTAAVDASVSQLEEGIREITRVPFPDALAMIRRGDISDGETIAALALAGIHLGRFR